MNVKLSGNGDQVGLQRIPDYTGVGLEGFHCRASPLDYIDDKGHTNKGVSVAIITPALPSHCATIVP